MRRNPLVGFCVVLGVGLLAATYAIWTLQVQVRQNQTLIRQQQQTVSELLDRSAEDRQQLSEQQRLVQALQEQVRRLGGTPLTQAPSPAATPSASRSSGGSVSPSPRPSAERPRPTRSPTPSPTPSQSPTPSPTPSPTCTVKVGPVCL